MANIVQRITLQGADAIKASLNGIATSANQAYGALTDANKANAALASIGTSVVKLQNDMRNFGVAARNGGQAAVAFGSAVSSALLRITGLSAGLGVALTKAVGALQREGGLAESLQQNADAAGLSTQKYEALTNALAQNGVGQDEAAKALDKASKFIKAAADQTDEYSKRVKKLDEDRARGKIGWREYQEQLEEINDSMGSAQKLAIRLGVAVRDQNGELRNVRDFALGAGQGLKELESATERNAAALEIFGRAGRKIGQAFGQGRAELERLEITMQGIAPSAKLLQQQALTALDDSFDNLGLAAKSLRRDLIAAFAPDVGSVVNAVTKFLSENREQFLAIAETIRAQLKPALDATLATLASPEFAAQFAQGIALAIDGVRAFARAIQDIIIPAFRVILDGANAIAEQLNRMFGTQLTGGVVLAGLVLAKFSGLLTVVTASVNLLVASFGILRATLPFVTLAVRMFWVALAGPIGQIALLVVAFTALFAALLQRFPQVRAAIIVAFTDPIRFIQGVWAGLVVWFSAIVNAIIAVFAPVTQFFVSLWNGVVTTAQTAWNGVLNVIKTAWAAIVAFFTPAVTFFQTLWTGIVTGAQTAWTTIQQGAQALWDFITSTAAAPFKFIGDQIEALWTRAKSLFDSMIQKVKEFLSVKSSAEGGDASGGGSNTVKAAGGGHIKGAGTATSDSILARLSNGEFVVRARAVAHYGPQLLHALNNMRLPKFANGGMAHAAQRLMLPEIPRFANGGAVQAPIRSGGRPMVLQIGDTVFDGLTASDNAVESISRYASGKSTRSAGRKPLWFKG